MKLTLLKAISITILTTLLVSTSPSNCLAQTTRTNTSLVKKGAVPVIISSQFSFTEGPAADKKGNIYFTDQPNNKIWKYDTKGGLSLYMDNAGRSNGMYFDSKGNLLTAADEKNELWSIDKQKQVTVLVKSVDGKLLNGPNDLWIHPKGGIYFTDPYYQRPWWTRKSSELEGKYVYYLPAGNSNPIAVVTNLKSPNGIIGTPDGKYLYVADIGDGKTYRYTIKTDGTLSEEKLFIKMGSDGMTIDNKGNIYLTGKGVTIVDPDGNIIENIPIDAKWTANVTFGGRKKNQLFITASEKVYKLDMKVKGGDGH